MLRPPALALLAFTALSCAHDRDARLAAEPSHEAVPRVPDRFQAWRAEVDALVTDALSKGQSFQLLSELCRVAPKRLSGSDGAQRAVEWAREAMLRCGLTNVRLEPVTVPHWERGEVEALFVLDERGLPARRLAVSALGGSVRTPPEGISAEVIEVKSFDELRQRAAEARGRIVLFNRPMDPAAHDCSAAYGGAVDQRTRGASEAAHAGALAALVRSVTMSLDDFPHTGSMSYDDDVAKIPAAAISTLAANEISARIAAGERVRLNLQLDCRTFADAPSANVVGEIVGSALPDEIVLVGGHLDAWDTGQGAHDDGGGCVHALEAARLIAARGLRPRRTIRVVMFMNEENGTRGAAGYFAAHQGERHVLALESDEGGFTPRAFSTDANPEAFATLSAAAALLERASCTAVIKGWGGVDIGPLAKAGVPLVGFLPDDERYFDHHHSARDTIEAVHPRELALGAGAIAGLIYVIADLPEALPANPPSAPGAH